MAKSESTTKTKTTRAAKSAPSSTSSKRTSSAPQGTATFEYFAPDAKQVLLAGSFNNWNAQATALKKDRTGRWRLEIGLEPGRYEYRYLVDGKWQNDQRPVSCVRNPFGTSNCVIEVSREN